MERLEQELRVARQRFGDDVQNLWKSIHTVSIQKICPKIIRDHFAVQASSIDSLEKQRLTIEKFLQANVDGKGKDKGGKSKKFEGGSFWCGACGHMMEDCQKKAAGKPQLPKFPRGPDPKPKGKGKGGKGKEGASSLDEWPDGQEAPPSDEKATEEVAGLFVCAVSRQREVQSTRRASLGKNPETGTRPVEILQEWKSLCQC